MKNSELVRKIVNKAEKLEFLADRIDKKDKFGIVWANKGYELASILCEDYDKEVGPLTLTLFNYWMMYAENRIFKLEVLEDFKYE